MLKLTEDELDYLDRILTNTQNKCNHKSGAMFTTCHQCEWISELQKKLKGER